jgi:hypothetical protein
MPNINDPTNTLSTFPTSIDSLPPVANGSGVNANNTATLWNKIETCLYRIESHTQQVVQVASNPEDRRRLTLLGTLINAAPAAQISPVISLTNAQMQFLGYQPFRQGNIIFADIYDKQGIVAVFTDIVPAEPNFITVYGRTLDYQDGTQVPAGTFQLKITILTRS